ncbi:Protein FIZZY-RELATED 2 [Acorus calamus]|uniref:Protein FIZZY-RELATED 2 n=1 Tax=Acorus calamus TaxID=4465 RepID=A0AAV9C4G8_ACOCL|nr:Protein FIZZY-RELATED 2 [Acorus calamus]
MPIDWLRSSDFYHRPSLPPSTSSSSSSPSTIADGGSGGASINDGSSAYSALLRTVLFGPDCGVVSPSTPEKSPHGRGSSPLTPPSRNIFRFKTESRRPYRSISPYDFDGALTGVVSPPPKALRKVTRSPFKVTKLCDLGAGDSVCSVGWAQRGTHLAVGTNNGKVELDSAMKASEMAQSLLNAEREHSRTIMFSDEEFKSLQLQVRDMLGDECLIKRGIVDGKDKTVFYETRVDNNGEALEFSSGEGLENKLFKDGKFELAKAKYEKVLREYNHVNPKDEEEGKIFLNSRRGIGSAKYFHRHISR